LSKRKTAIVLGKLIRELRKKRSLSQEKLSFISGIDRGYISMIELGNQLPSVETVLALCEALTIPFGHFASIFAEKLKEISD
jgi:transcriptional regulator with XRE-family HTH domain